MNWNILIGGAVALVAAVMIWWSLAPGAPSPPAEPAQAAAITSQPDQAQSPPAGTAQTTPADKAPPTPLEKAQSIPAKPAESIQKPPARKTEPSAEDLARQQTEQQIQAGLTRAGRALDNGDFDTSVKEYQSVLNLASGNQTARTGLNNVRRARQKRIQAILANAEESMKKGDYDSAIASYQFALGLDPGDSKLQAKLQKARDARKAECEIIGCD